MQKYPIGFNMNTENISADEVTEPVINSPEPRKSIVQVYFQSRDRSWPYYNDQFDLKLGDSVYVDGKLEGKLGKVININYSFRIKLSDYKKVIAQVDTGVEGEFHFVGAHAVTFDKNAINYSKIINWFKAPENEEDYVSGDDDSCSFPLDDLSSVNFSQSAVSAGHEYFIGNSVIYVEINGSHGHALVDGNDLHEVEFDYSDGEISNMKCSCYCIGACKHQFAVILQLREIVDYINENHYNQYNDYFAAMSKVRLVQNALDKSKSAKFSFRQENLYEAVKPKA